MPRDNDIPQKINPDESSSGELDILNAFRSYVIENKSEIGENTAANTLKVIDCLRFIKVNRNFIQYAVAHPEENSLYQSAKDKNERLLRDFNLTSFHFIDYDLNLAAEKAMKKARSEGLDEEAIKATGKTAREHQPSACWQDFSDLIARIENGYEQTFNLGLAKYYAQKFHWDRDIGCLEVRTAGALCYLAQIASCPIVHIEVKLQEAFAAEPLKTLRLSGQYTAEEMYQHVFDYFEQHDYFGQLTLFGADVQKIVVDTEAPKDILVLTRVLLAKYLHAYCKIVEDDADLPPVPVNIYLPMPKPEDLTAENALKLIHNQRGLVKTIGFSESKNSHDIDFHLKQLKNPQHERPVRPLHPDFSQDKVFNPKTQTTLTRVVAGERGSSKEKPFVKKTAISHPPGNGAMESFGKGIGTVAFWYDSVYCDLKGEKYTFPMNIGSDVLKLKKWHDAPQSVGMEGLQHQNMTAMEIGIVLEHNEVDASPSLQGLRAISATSDTIEGRLNALRAKLHIDKTHRIDRPLFIHSPHKPVNGERFLPFSFKQQLYDVIDYRNSHKKQSRDLQCKEAQFLQDFYLYYGQENLREEGPQKTLFLLSYLDWVFSLAKRDQDSFLTQPWLLDYLHNNFDLSKETFLAQCQHNDVEAILDLLVAKHPAFLEAQDSEGDTLLHLVTLLGNSKLCACLLQKEANLTAQNALGNTPLHIACEKTLVPTAKLFITHGARLDEPKNNAGETPRQKIVPYRYPHKNAGSLVGLAVSITGCASILIFMFIFALRAMGIGVPSLVTTLIISLGGGVAMSISLELLARRKMIKHKMIPVSLAIHQRLTILGNRGNVKSPRLSAILEPTPRSTHARLGEYFHHEGDSQSSDQEELPLLRQRQDRDQAYDSPRSSDLVTVTVVDENSAKNDEPLAMPTFDPRQTFRVHS